jgi:hypothetical protein
VVVVGATALEIDAWSHQHAKSNFTNAELTQGWVIRVKSRRAHQRDLWLFYSGDEDEVDLERLYHAYVHRFDIEHFFRFAKQRLGLVAVTLRHPERSPALGAPRDVRLRPTGAGPRVRPGPAPAVGESPRGQPLDTTTGAASIFATLGKPLVTTRDCKTTPGRAGSCSRV